MKLSTETTETIKAILATESLYTGWLRESETIGGKIEKLMHQSVYEPSAELLDEMSSLYSRSEALATIYRNNQQGDYFRRHHLGKLLATIEPYLTRELEELNAALVKEQAKDAAFRREHQLENYNSRNTRELMGKISVIESVAAINAPESASSLTCESIVQRLGLKRSLEEAPEQCAA
ncbi:MAG: hypothetical protein ACSHX9_02160 [Luteolibacter sp.]